MALISSYILFGVLYLIVDRYIEDVELRNTCLVLMTAMIAVFMMALAIWFEIWFRLRAL